jgi:hypothetical protein
MNDDVQDLHMFAVRDKTAPKESLSTRKKENWLVSQALKLEEACQHALDMQKPKLITILRQHSFSQSTDPGTE